jgi:hypothetical protein
MGLDIGGVEAGTSVQPVDDTWRQATAVIDHTSGDGGSVAIFFYPANWQAGTPTRTCFSVDDVFLYRTK